MNMLEKFQLEFPELVDKMKKTSHHYDNFHLNPYHFEGDIWSHTMMVHNFANDVNLHSNLDEEDIELLKYMTLLHDLGKYYAREEKEDRKLVTFYGHAGISFYLAIDVLKKFDVLEKDQRLILEVISLHHSYMDILALDCGDKIRERAFKTFIGNERLFKLLIAHMKCDSLGRFCLEHETQYWEFVNLHRHYHVDYAKDHKDLSVASPTAVVLIGVPNVGKSSFIENTVYKNHKTISSDNIIEEIGEGENYNEKFASVDEKDVNTILQEDFKSVVADRESFVIDRTNVSKKLRRSFLGQLPKDYIKIGIVFVTGFEEVFARNALRKGKVLKDHVIFDMMKSFAVPTYDDFDVIQWVFSKEQDTE